MTRLLSLAALIIALVALAAPSLASGHAVGVPAPVWTADAGVEQAIVSPGCKSPGGKRTLHCHPDLGVLTGAMPLLPHPDQRQIWRELTLPLAAAAPEAELPPPRLG